MFNQYFKNNQSGFGIIEILVVIVVISVAFFGLFRVGILFMGFLENNDSTMRASYLAEGGMEAVRNFRDNTDWDVDGLGVLTMDTDYHPNATTTGWIMRLGSETTGEFTRAIRFSNVNRDSGDDITSGAGTFDPDTKKVTVNIDWSVRDTDKNFSLTAYFTNFHE